MKRAKLFITLLSGVLLMFFIIALVCFVYYDSMDSLYNLFFAQLIMFFLATCSIVIYCLIPLFRKVRGSVPEIARIVLLSEKNSPTDEFSLVNRTSALIGKSNMLTVSFDEGYLTDEYAVINRAGSFWYVERVSEARNIGLKRAGEQYVYKMKPGMSYKLQINDIIYIENERLLVI